MFKKLDAVEKKYDEVGMQLQNPDVVNDQNRYRALMKELAEMEKVVEAYRSYKKNISERDGNKELLSTEKDEELRSMAKEEIQVLEKEIVDLEQQLKILLLPKDPNDGKDIILEIRAGAGGDESCLFAEELLKGYSHYASSQGWKFDVLSQSFGNAGGYKEVSASITGDSVYSKLKYEMGVHRVQRVPKTESQGRVHTSTVTVAVLPQAEEVDVKIEKKDLQIDTFRASGAGGQHVNTTDSAVRITHVPSGTVVSCQDGRSQTANKEMAMKILYSRILAHEQEKAHKEMAEERSSQVGTGDRSERIRTYNFPQSRMTDHRIGLTLHSLNEVMGGGFEQVIDPLITHFQAEQLKKQSDPA